MKNIFNGLNFSGNIDESAYDLLLPQKDNFTSLTYGELEMEINAVDAYLKAEPMTLATLFTVYIIAPRMGNYRRKIFTVIERRNVGRFPVEIFCHIDNIKDENIQKDNFLAHISELFSRNNVKAAIEDLFRQSKDIPEKK